MPEKYYNEFKLYKVYFFIKGTLYQKDLNYKHFQKKFGLFFYS